MKPRTKNICVSVLYLRNVDEKDVQCDPTKRYPPKPLDSQTHTIGIGLCDWLAADHLLLKAKALALGLASTAVRPLAEER